MDRLAHEFHVIKYPTKQNDFTVVHNKNFLCLCPYSSIVINSYDFYFANSLASIPLKNEVIFFLYEAICTWLFQTASQSPGVLQLHLLLPGRRGRPAVLLQWLPRLRGGTRRGREGTEERQCRKHSMHLFIWA